MSCPGGACGKEGLEYRMVFFGILMALFAIGLVWISGYRKTASALAAIPLAMWFFGDRLSRALDRAVNAATAAWRAHARRAGRTYCPECGGALSAASRPVAGPGCPSCGGAWVRTGDLMAWLAAYGTTESTWRAIARDELSPARLCPECAVPLEPGSLDRLQPLFDRCAACGGHWISRLAWTWFELTPPPRPKAIRPPARAESSVPELVLRKDASP